MLEHKDFCQSLNHVTFSPFGFYLDYFRDVFRTQSNINDETFSAKIVNSKKTPSFREKAS